jgi:hypothetical protein
MEDGMRNAGRMINICVVTALLTWIWPAYGEGEFSGFLGDYSKLTEVKDASGETVLRYVNPDVTPGTYHAICVDPIEYYPVPKPTEQVSAQTLAEIADYMDKGIRDALSPKISVVTEPGPGIARMRAAITAVAPKSPGLRPYELLPIGFLISAARGRGKEATIQVEVQVVDSVTGELIGESVRKGTGAKLASETAPLSLKDIQPLLDKWIETGTQFMEERLFRSQ